MADDRYALVVATTTYKDPELKKLDAPGQDADALAKVLRDPEIGRFKVETLMNKSSALVNRRIEGFFSDRRRDDTLLLFFSGHGIKDDRGRFFIATRDTERKFLQSTSIRDDFLQRLMGDSLAGSQVLILDCCYGGAFAKSLIRKGDEHVDVVDRFQGSGRVILTASTAMQYAYEGDSIEGDTALSVFTGTLVDGLRSGEADTDRDDLVSVQNLYEFASARVAQVNSKQTPTISAIGQEGTIFVAYVPKSLAVKRLPLSSTSPATGATHDLSPWVQVKDQGAEGSNPALAATVAFETSLALRGAHMALSPRYVYQKGKQLAGYELEADTGLMVDTVIEVIERFGAPPADAWPYVPTKTRLPRGKKWAQLDELATQRRARAFPISAYDEIPHHLRHGRPVLASFYVHRSNWYGGDSAKPGLLHAPEPDEPLLGSVLLTIVGFDEADGSIRFAHSWGDGWGDRGFGSMERETAEAIFAGGLMWAIEPRTEDGFRWASPAITPVAPDGTAVAAEPAAPKRRPPRRRRSGLLRKVYDAKSQLTSDFEGLTLARGEGDAATGDAAVDETYDAMGAFFNFFLEVFDRRSLDDEGAPLEAVVHYGSSFSNAWWDGQRLIVGDGDAKLFNGFYSCPEVLAAELSHGVIARETQLSYDGESGALSQSIGQVFGLLVKQHALKQDVEAADWLVGAGLFMPEVNAKALFSMAAPGSAYDDPSLGKDPQPAHMSDYVKTEADNGGIHTNAGIPNHAFYLVAMALGGNAWERSGRIWYEALCASGESEAMGFRQFAERTLVAARRMYGARSKELKAVRQAWTEVGVLESSRS